MRNREIVQGRRSSASHDHVCWSYASGAEFRCRAGEFLAEGLKQGQQVCYVGSGEPGALTATLRRLDGIEAALASSAARVASLEAGYPTGAAIEPDDQVRVYSAATERALAAGYRGYRVAVEATALVRSERQLAAFLHYEYLIDRYMAEHPFSALCGYDSTQLRPQALAQLASVHPRANVQEAGFRLHASAKPGHAAEFSGEIDLSNRDLFLQVLDRIRPQVDHGRLVLDAAGLTFIDPHSLLTLVEYARDLGATLVLHTDCRSARRIAAVLDVPDLRMEPVR